VICKDCKPNYLNQRGEYDGVALCHRHAEMEQQSATLGALVANVEDEQRERRRYALLQAAATIYGAYTMSPALSWDTALCVSEAGGLLAEIEKREAREGQS
jgi:hypothetical protein